MEITVSVNVPERFVSYYRKWLQSEGERESKAIDFIKKDLEEELEANLKTKMKMLDVVLTMAEFDRQV